MYLSKGEAELQHCLRVHDGVGVDVILQLVHHVRVHQELGEEGDVPPEANHRRKNRRGGLRGTQYRNGN